MYGHMVLFIPEVARAQIEERRREADRIALGRRALRMFPRSGDNRAAALSGDIAEAPALPLAA